MEQSKRLFEMGMLYITPGVQKIMCSEVMDALEMHARGDWGEVGPEDWEANEHALGYGGRILSAYFTAHGVKFWVITEADRSTTTILLPEEY